MDRFAIFLDAGYFFSAGAQAITGSSTQRKFITLKAADKAVEALCSAASAQVANAPLLRAYWYDAMPGPRLSLEQNTLALLPFVKLRLGVLNHVGEQKGVDSLIVTDLIELARNRAIADAVIVSGDEDLRIAVQVAQSFGVRVHVLAAGNPRGNVSISLQMEADSVGMLPSAWFAQHLVINKPAMPPAITPLPGTLTGSSRLTAPDGIGPDVGAFTLEGVAETICSELLAAANTPQITALKEHFVGSNSVPSEFDGKLIARTSAKLGGRKLTSEEMRRVRGVFVKTIRAAPNS